MFVLVLTPIALVVKSFLPSDQSRSENTRFPSLWVPPPQQTGSYLYLSGLSLENRTSFKYLRIKEFNVRIRTYMNFGRAGRWGVKGKGVKVLEIYRFKVIEIYKFEAPKLLIRKLLQFLGDFFLPIVYWDTNASSLLRNPLWIISCQYDWAQLPLENDGFFLFSIPHFVWIFFVDKLEPSEFTGKGILDNVVLSFSVMQKKHSHQSI